MMKEKLTVLIPTRNRAEDLQKSLGHMQNCDLHRLRYVIYDDASDEVGETIEAANTVKSVQVINGTQRIGQAGGRNILLRACKTPYALFMDDDTWFVNAKSLHGTLKNDLVYPGIGKASAVCSQVFRTDDGATIFPENLKTRQIINPFGAGCLVRTKDILRIGAFRSYWRYRHEETELGLRMWKNHLPVVYDASLVVEHCHTAAARSSREYDLNSARNLILMHTLNLPGFTGMPLGFLRALRLLLVQNYHRPSLLQGIGEGLLDSVRFRHDIDPMTPIRYKHLREFMREIDGCFQTD